MLQSATVNSSCVWKHFATIMTTHCAKSAITGQNMHMVQHVA